MSELLYCDSFKHAVDLVNIGVTVFERNKSKYSGTECIYRIVQDGVLSILPYLTKRVVRSKNFDIFKKLISSRYNGFQLTDLCGDKEVFEQIDDLTSGCFVFVLDLPDQDGAQRVEALSMHKFNGALSTMISKDAALSLHMRYLTAEERVAAQAFFNVVKDEKDL